MKTPKSFMQWKQDDPTATFTPAILNPDDHFEDGEWDEAMTYAQRLAWFESRKNFAAELVQDGILNVTQAENYLRKKVLLNREPK